MSLFHSALGSRRPTSFPSLAQTGLLVQTTDDYTNFAVSFTGVGRAPGSSVLELEYSNDNSTNWTQFATFSIDFPRAGSIYAGGGGEYSTNFSALTYAVGRGFRGRWVNSILNYTGSYTSLGVTTYTAWNIGLTPAAPDAINNYLYNTLNGVTGEMHPSFDHVAGVQDNNYSGQLIEYKIRNYYSVDGFPPLDYVAIDGAWGVLETDWPPTLHGTVVYDHEVLFGPITPPTYTFAGYSVIFIRYAVLSNGTPGTGILGSATQSLSGP